MGYVYCFCQIIKGVPGTSIPQSRVWYTYKVIDIIIDQPEMEKVYQTSGPLSLLYPLLCLATLTVTTTNKEESNKENNKAKDSKSRIIHQNNNNNNNNNVTTRTKGLNFYKLAINTKINLRYKYKFCMWTDRKKIEVVVHTSLLSFEQVSEMLYWELHFTVCWNGFK